MPTYLHVQEETREDGVLPWPVLFGEDGTITTPSSRLGMRTAIGFQRELVVKQVDIDRGAAFADPAQLTGTHLVYTSEDGTMGASTVKVAKAEVVEYAEPIPVEY